MDELTRLIREYRVPIKDIASVLRITPNAAASRRCGRTPWRYTEALKLIAYIKANYETEGGDPHG